MRGAVEVAPLGVDDLARDQLEHEGLRAAGVRAGGGAFHLDQEVVRNDLVFFQDPFHQAVGCAFAQGLPQSPLVIAVASGTANYGEVVTRLSYWR